MMPHGAYFCYCAYVLRISKYSGFLWVVPTNTGIFFARLKTMRKKQNLASAFGIHKENGGGGGGSYHAFFRDNKASIWKKQTPYIALYFTAF